ncbi:MAG: GYD domain-containing protein [Halodesulfurarchaeum sp.]
MPTYIRLTELTREGFEEIEESATRTEHMKAMANEMGGSIEDVFLTMGEYDFITIAEFPNDQMYTQFALRFAEEGTNDTKTLKALEEDEYLSVIQSL